MQFALCAFSCSTLHRNMCTHSCNLYCCAKMICHSYRIHIDIYIYIYSEAAPSPDCPLEKFCCKSSDPQSQQKIIAALILTTAAAHGVGDKIWRSRNALKGRFFSSLSLSLGAVARHKHPNPGTAWESSAKTVSTFHELKWKRNENIFCKEIKICLIFTLLARDA